MRLSKRPERAEEQKIGGFLRRTLVREIMFQQIDHLAWTATSPRVISWNPDCQHLFKNHHSFHEVEAIPRSYWESWNH